MPDLAFGLGELRLGARLRILRQFAANAGAGALLDYAVQRTRERRLGPGECFRLRSSRPPVTVEARARTSDRWVFRQIFLEREYSCLDDVREPGLVVDCGANVGYSAAYFLARFPTCRVIAVEPDPANFEQLRRNVRPFGDRCTPVHAAVWSHPGDLVVRDAGYRGGGSWAMQVAERAEAGTRVRGVDIGTLLDDSGHERISILKIDVEGAEAEIFSSGYEGWIDRVDNLVIELHDDTSFGDCSAIFHRAIAGRGFTLSRQGELTVCKRAAPAPAPTA